jgi:hypothetical protein
MIVVRLYGGLGNQLFQYATARALAIRCNTELVLDLSWFEAIPKSNTKREYELNHFNIKARQPRFAERVFFSICASRFFSIILNLIPLFKVFRESKFNFDERFKSITGHIYLNGYWQSYKYFESYRDQICNELKVLDSIANSDLLIASKIQDSISVSIHVRRGDYVSKPSAESFHGICGLDYYALAIATIFKKFPEAHFYVFSDDMDWSKANLPLNAENSTFVSHNNSSAVNDMRLMSMCKHHVIANSSFSWWAAWLNPGDGKVVIAPEKWFAVEPQPKTLLPKNWIIL